MLRPSRARPRRAGPRRSAEALQGIAHPVQCRVDVQQLDSAKAQQKPRAYRCFAEERRQRIQAHLHLARQVGQQLDIDPGLGQRAEVEARAGRDGAEPR